MEKLIYPKKYKKAHNVYFCSDGTRITQDEIDRKRSEAYRIKYADNPTPMDEGFGKERAQCTAHIISQARCKQIGKTELIWDLDNMFPATHASNQAIENPKGKAWKSLKNVNKCLSYIQVHDKELYNKFLNSCDPEDRIETSISGEFIAIHFKQIK